MEGLIFLDTLQSRKLGYSMKFKARFIKHLYENYKLSATH